MAHAARRPRHGLLSFLDSDGRAHPVQNAFAVVALVVGLLAVTAAALTERQVWDLHLVASWAGLAGVLVGARGQFISATTAERFLLVIGLGTSGVGLFLGLAFGGLFG
jgi:hypothetical protein